MFWSLFYINNNNYNNNYYHYFDYSFRIHEDNDFSLIHKRYIEEDDASGEPTLVLVAKHVDHATGTETVGTSWFKYSGPSPSILNIFYYDFYFYLISFYIFFNLYF